MEALAFKAGITLARDLGCQRIQCETDSQELVKLWGMESSSDRVFLRFSGKLEILVPFFRAFFLSFAPRTYNLVAHVLAK